MPPTTSRLSDKQISFTLAVFGECHDLSQDICQDLNKWKQCFFLPHMDDVDIVKFLVNTIFIGS